MPPLRCDAGPVTSASIDCLARVLRAGEERRVPVRRRIPMAIEDIGLADPFAVRVALDGADILDCLGSPESDLALVQVVLYLARAKKSNAVDKAYGRALEDVERTAAEPVPRHLRNAATKLMQDAGYGKGHRYAHDDRAAAREMTCLPPGLLDRRQLQPDPTRR